MRNTLEKKHAVKNGIGRMIFAVLSLMVELSFLFLLVLYFYEKVALVLYIVRFLAFIIVLGLYGAHKTANIKMPWIMLILVLPLVGVLLYLTIGLDGSTNKMRRRFEDVDKVLLPMLPANESVIEKANAKDKRIANMAKLLKSQSGYPIYENTKVTYYDDGLKGLEAQKEEMRKAENFIFMEYHAIEDAESWEGISEILSERANAGVEVRLSYDDMGSIGFINTDFVKRMKALGIDCRVFNPFSRGLNFFLNNRDHRKITVIDGKVGFIGGYNLANEYFHVTEPYGFWKDTGIKLEGDAVDSLAVTFLEMWDAVSDKDKKENIEDFSRYLGHYTKEEGENGFVQPYADSPMDELPVGEDVYMNMASSAQDYVWFVTPYLIITDEMTSALTLSAKRGVDVRIITPGIPDKKIVYSVTRSYYNALARQGVRVFEYTPGFCHCKMSVCDDTMATCGTINMDYRSLYHHFENGCVYADSQAVLETKHDFEKMFEASNEVTEYYATGRGAFLRLGQMLLRLIAPLM
ncbi:MAG: cardiolipin synthase [Lachnospiraceae bacterium]|nr:cardiolipin synthase [Lachnospiraceae bacterium]